MHPPLRGDHDRLGSSEQPLLAQGCPRGGRTLPRASYLRRDLLLRRSYLRPFLVATLFAALALSSAPAIGGPVAPKVRFDKRAEDCLEAVPASASVSGITDDGSEIDMEVLFLLDGVSLTDAQEAVAATSAPYASLDIKLIPTYRTVSFTSNGNLVEAGISRPNGDADRMLREARVLVGGQRPADVDVVYVMTNKDLFTFADADADGKPDEDERDYSVAGKAACIGGARFDAEAFAIGEHEIRAEDQLLVASRLGDFTAKVAAHEIGHLLGAHHHYANCHEGLAKEVAAGGNIDAGPCTLMINDVSLATLQFSTVDSVVVRGHAVRYASP